jgi:flagellar biosynthesis/type III secretory pathway protein FliH
MYRIHPSVYEKADPALLELIEKAKVGNLSEEEYLRYEAGLKALEDYIDFDEMLAEAQAKVEEIEAKLEEAQAMAAEQQAKAKAEGRTQGRAEGEKYNQIETAKRMLNENLSAELISKLTGLSQDEVDKLR